MMSSVHDYFTFLVGVSFLHIVTLTCQHLLSTPTPSSGFGSDVPRSTINTTQRPSALEYTNKTTENHKGTRILKRLTGEYYRRQVPTPGYGPFTTGPPVIYPADGSPAVDVKKLDNTTQQRPDFPFPGHTGADAVAHKFTVPKKVDTKRTRTIPYRGTVNFSNCEYNAMHCLKAYDTGKVCGRTFYYRYYEFKNYCMLDYVNCLEKFEMWQILNMGECFLARYIGQYNYQHYEYSNENFMDQYYLLELDQVYGSVV